MLKDLSKALNISINELLSGEEIKELKFEHSDTILLNSVNNYTYIEKRKGLNYGA